MKCFLALLASMSLFAFPAGAANQPNIVIFLADDSGWGDYSVNGNTNIRTPNIDSLARNGAVLDRFFVCAVCAPTRAEMLTGRYHPRGGVRGVSTGQERLNLDEVTIADTFKAAGYATGAFGKWHNGSQFPYHPNGRGFEEYYGFTSGHWGEYFDPPLDHNGKLVRGKGYVIDDLTDHALQFIAKNKTKPFLAYLPYNTPHSPWTVPDEYWQRFKDKPVGMRAKPGDPEDLDHTRCALAMVENIDWNVGRVLKQLDDLQLAENTIVIYFSDNGPNSWRWNGGMKGRKGSTDEGGVRSVCFIRWPAKIKAGTQVEQVSGAIDLLPTLASLSGVKLISTKELDGKNLSPLLLGNSKEYKHGDRMIFSHQNGNVSVRTQQYRLDNRGALFDMVADPGQEKDVAAEKPEVAKRLAAAVAGWREDVGVSGDDGKGKGRGGLPADDRPFPVGYREFPTTPLPARDGEPHGGVERSSRAPNCSYFVNWKSKDDKMTWDIDVKTAGNYDVTIHYTAAESGAMIELEFQGSRLAGKVAPAWNPPLYTNQDTLPRPPAESQMKEFRPLKLGTLKLPKGRGPLTLRATDIPGSSVMDVRLIELTLKN
jgi:arylsulfatase A-like enzyme